MLKSIVILVVQRRNVMKKGFFVGILLFIIVILVFVGIGGYFYLKMNEEPSIAENSILRIELAGSIKDNNGSYLKKGVSIRDLFYQVRRAKIDKRIKAIYLNISSFSAGFAKTEDIGLIIKDFRESNKKVYAFVETGGLREIYLASFADKVFLFKGGYFYLNGLASEAMFLKDSLSKIGIEAQLFHRGDYKTYSNMFMEEGMTEPHRDSLQTLLDDIYNSTLNGLAKNRKIDVAKIKALINELPITNEPFKKIGLVDVIGYDDEVIKEIKGNNEFINYSVYKETTKPLPFKGNKKIAVIFVAGEIHSGKSGGKSLFGNKILGSTTVAAQLKKARLDKNVKAVVLRIDSPGGSAVASEVIRREASLIAKEKHLVISMGDVAASGGYWISMASSSIFALEQTITASIGVVTGKFVLKGLYDKIGLKKTILKTSDYADIYSDYKKFDERELRKINLSLNSTYNDFVNLVSKSRGIKREKLVQSEDRSIIPIAEGRVWSGLNAKRLKLIDKIGGLYAAINEAKKLSGIKDTEEIGISIYPKRPTLMSLIMSYLGGGTSMITSPMDITKKLSVYNKFFPAFVMPYTVDIK